MPGGEEQKREDGGRTKAATAGTVAANDNQMIGGDWGFSKKPKFLDDRLAIWNEYFKL